LKPLGDDPRRPRASRSVGAVLNGRKDAFAKKVASSAAGLVLGSNRRSVSTGGVGDVLVEDGPVSRVRGRVRQRDKNGKVVLLSFSEFTILS
jgi:hypothetical protein